MSRREIHHLLQGTWLSWLLAIPLLFLVLPNAESTCCFSATGFDPQFQNLDVSAVALQVFLAVDGTPPSFESVLRLLVEDVDSELGGHRSTKSTCRLNSKGQWSVPTNCSQSWSGSMAGTTSMLLTLNCHFIPHQFNDQSMAQVLVPIQGTVEEVVINGEVCRDSTLCSLSLALPPWSDPGWNQSQIQPGVRGSMSVTWTQAKALGQHSEIDKLDKRGQWIQYHERNKEPPGSNSTDHDPNSSDSSTSDYNSNKRNATLVLSAVCTVAVLSIFACYVVLRRNLSSVRGSVEGRGDWADHDQSSRLSRRSTASSRYRSYPESTYSGPGGYALYRQRTLRRQASAHWFLGQWEVNTATKTTSGQEKVASPDPVLVVSVPMTSPVSEQQVPTSGVEYASTERSEDGTGELSVYVCKDCKDPTSGRHRKQ